jgi:ABC-type branched-subunit amino acid transport system substrate-binding protein
MARRRSSAAAAALVLALGVAGALLAPAAAQPSAVPKPTPKPAAALPAAPAKAAGGAGKTFKIGCLLPLSGGKSNTGNAVKAAMEMAVKDLKDRLPGVDIQLVCQDSQCGDVPALRAAATLARSDNVGAHARAGARRGGRGALGARRCGRPGPAPA